MALAGCAKDTTLELSHGKGMRYMRERPAIRNNISHAHNVTRRRWSVNLQAVKALVNGAPKRIRVCAGCIKDGKIVKA